MVFWRGKLWAALLLFLTYPTFLFGSFVLWAVAGSADFSGTGRFDRFVYVPLLVAAILSAVATRLIWRAFAPDGQGVRVVLAILALLPCVLTVLLFTATLATQ